MVTNGGHQCIKFSWIYLSPVATWSVSDGIIVLSPDQRESSYPFLYKKCDILFPCTEPLFCGRVSTLYSEAIEMNTKEEIVSIFPLKQCGREKRSSLQGILHCLPWRQGGDKLVESAALSFPHCRWAEAEQRHVQEATLSFCLNKQERSWGFTD